MKIRFLVTVFLVLSFAAGANAGNVYFDVSHRVIFQPDSDKPLGLKRFVSLFEESGKKVLVGTPDLANNNKKMDLLILPGSMTPYSTKEIDLIEKFVKEGGSLLVLLHIAPPLARVTEKFGIVLSNAVISESENIIEGSSQDFYALDLSSHPLMDGVSSIALYGTWGLLAEKNAEIVASTSDEAFMDFNRNRVLDKAEGELEIKVGVVAVSEYGSGKVVVVADDAPLANAFLDKGDNLKLAKNIISWLTK